MFNFFKMVLSRNSMNFVNKIIFHLSADVNDATSIRSLPSFKRTDEVWEYLEDFIRSIHICPNFLTRAPLRCTLCSRKRPAAATYGKHSCFSKYFIFHFCRLPRDSGLGMC